MRLTRAVPSSGIAGHDSSVEPLVKVDVREEARVQATHDRASGQLSALKVRADVRQAAQAAVAGQDDVVGVVALGWEQSDGARLGL